MLKNSFWGLSFKISNTSLVPCSFPKWNCHIHYWNAHDCNVIVMKTSASRESSNALSNVFIFFLTQEVRYVVVASRQKLINDRGRIHPTGFDKNERAGSFQCSVVTTSWVFLKSTNQLSPGVSQQITQRSESFRSSHPEVCGFIKKRLNHKFFSMRHFPQQIFYRSRVNDCFWYM